MSIHRMAASDASARINESNKHSSQVTDGVTAKAQYALETRNFEKGFASSSASGPLTYSVKEAELPYHASMPA